MARTLLVVPTVAGASLARTCLGLVGPSTGGA